MKHLTKEHPYKNDNLLLQSVFKEDTLFFDIETTGFSALSSSLYLIGCAYHKKDRLIVEQFFAENPSEEGILLKEFLSLAKSFSTLCCFNGTTFDLPYLHAKCEQCHLENTLADKEVFDIYRQVFRYKKLFHLESLRLKSLEKFLGIDREDQFDGKELISVYRRYQKAPTASEEQFLLLHNYEDIVNMLPLCNALSYPYFFQHHFSITDIFFHDRESDYSLDDLQDGKSLTFLLKPDYPFPKEFSLQNEYATLIGKGTEAVLQIPVFSGTLLHFLPDYKNYYYLPEEDTAIHKSVASFVEKTHRKQASAATCYIKKEGEFLPQPKELVTPSFFKKYKDSVSYFLLPEGLVKTDSVWEQYCFCIIKELSKS